MLEACKGILESKELRVNVKTKMISSTENAGKFTEEGKYLCVLFLWSNSLVVAVLDSQSRGCVFKTTGWLQG